VLGSLGGAASSSACINDARCAKRAECTNIHAARPGRVDDARRAVGHGSTVAVLLHQTDRDGTTTVLMTNRGLVDERSRPSHRDGCEGSFDNLARLVSR
jgi:hypothetical protein